MEDHDYESSDDEDLLAFDEKDLEGTTPANPSFFTSHYSPIAQVPHSCICCEMVLPNQKEVLQHLYSVHSLVIGDVEKISELPKYLSYWKSLFSGKSSEIALKQYCSTIDTNESSPNGEKKHYYLLSDIIEEDKKIRILLREQRLSQLLKVQEEERFDTSFHRKCLFCKQRFSGDRKIYFSHMYNVHGFNIGLPDNLVYINEFLDTLQYKIDNLVCIYCERVFKNYGVLKLHMRKKKHFKLNPHNKFYDKYYLINYLEEGKSWKEMQKEDDSEDEDTDDRRSVQFDNWDDWKEEEENQEAETSCLFCSKISKTPDDCLKHCKDSHNFDLFKIKSEWNLDLYATIKLVNYTRQQVINRTCPNCELFFPTAEELLKHMNDVNHFKVQRTSYFWNDAKFLLSTLKNDPLLYILDDVASDDEEEKNIQACIPLDDVDENTISILQKTGLLNLKDN